MTPAPTPPTGESAPPSLEEGGTGAGDTRAQLDIIASAAFDEIQDARAVLGLDLGESLVGAITRLTAEVARLTAERDAAEARAARAEEALAEAREMLDLPRTLCYKRSAANGLLWDAKEVECIHNRVLYSYGALDRALTKGVDHA